MKKILLMITSFFLFCGMIFPSITSAAEEAKINSKDEAVYVTLDPAGNEKEVYIVNSFEVGKAGVVTDYGKYSEIKNLTNSSDITQETGHIRLDVEEGKFYYQGTVKEYQLPWEFNVSYELDGKKQTPEQLIGKDGRLIIDISVKENKQANSAFYENYVVQISVPLNVEVFSRIKATDAVMASVGKNKQATYTVMPGKEGKYVIEADVENFEMGSIEFSAMPFTMAFDAPDIENMKSEMTTLADAVNDVHKGVSEFRTGIGSMYDGMGQLKNGSASYKNGIEQLSQSSTQLVDGSSEISSALKEMSGYLSILDEFELPNTDEIEEGFQLVLSYLKEMKASLDQTIQNNEDVKNELQTILQSIQETKITEEDWKLIRESGVDEEIVSGLRSAYEASLQLKPVINDVNKALDQANGELKEIASYLSQTIEELEEQGEELTQLVTGMDAAKDLQQLKDGVNTFVSSYSQFHTGLVKYTNGVDQLALNYKEIDNGIAQTRNGIGELQTGANSLYDGTKKLSDATSDLPDQMTEEIDQLLAEYDKTDFKPVSFTSTKNKQIDVVQFVIKTEEMKQEGSKDNKSNEEEKTSIWQRFLDLFR